MITPQQYQTINASESKTLEFKTSLLFYAGSSQVGEDQLDVITRTIAAMINSEGGELLIGVNDNGMITSSVIDEFHLLNSVSPYYGNHYPGSIDGYKRFILDWVGKNLSNYATTLLSFEFPQYGDYTICKIVIKKSAVPVWFKQTSLFVRADASTRQLRGNDITSFISQISPDDLTKAITNNQTAFNNRLKEIKANEPQTGSILVVYPNGDFIHEGKSVRTLLEVIHRAGIVDVRNLGLPGRIGKGNTPYVPFVGKTCYFDNANKGKNGKTQRELDGYYVFVKYSIGDMISKLTQISNGLGLGLHIEVF